MVDGKKKLLDVVARAKLKEQDYSFLVHVEAESGNKSEFPKRFFQYFCSLYLKYDAPVFPIVIYSFDNPKDPKPNSYVVDLPHFVVNQFNYKVVQLNRLNWRDFLKQKNPVAAALMSKMNIDPGDRPRVKAQCLRLLVSLKLDEAKMYFISSFVDTYLKLDDSEEEIFQSELDTIKPLEKQKIMTITTSWEQRGIAKGKF